MMGPPYCAYGLRVPASCVCRYHRHRAACPEAPRTVRTGYAYQPRACRTYRVPCGAPQARAGRWPCRQWP
eukprot:scaffold55054_cov61-Phaeocystis_antarctica.AAC.5